MKPLLLFFLIPFFCNAQSQVLDQKQAEIIDGHIQQLIRLENFEGAVLVGKEGKVVFEKGYGMANHEWQIPNTPSTKYDLASISKQFTAVLILQLCEEGKLALEETISTYLPNYRKEVADKVTIHHLLTHQSGIPNYTSIPYVWEDSLRNHYTQQELINKFCSGDLEFEPGSQYSYSNSGYVLLAAIAEAVTQKTLETLIVEKIADPLGLNSLVVDNEAKIISKRANGYVGYGNNLQKANYTHMANLIGAGNLIASVKDLFLWNAALHGGSDQLLSSESLKAMLTPYTESNTWITPYKNGYGYGVGTADIALGTKKTAMIFHSGHISGFSGFMAYLPKKNYFAVILSNKGSIPTPSMHTTVQQIFKVLEVEPINNGK